MVVGYAGLGIAAWAQEGTAPAISPALEDAPAPNNELTPEGLRASTVQRVIAIRNVSPTLMAWWIDPAHNEEPVGITGSESRKNKAVAAPQNQAKAQTKGVFELPTGIASISPIVAQNALLVAGTEEAIAKLRETVAFLDRPLRQVEVEVQFVQVNEADAKVFGVDFGKEKAGPGNFSIGFIRGNMGATLNRLIAEKKAKVISAPRVRAINNLTATLGSLQSQPAVIGFKNDKGKFQELFDPLATKGDAHLLLGTSSHVKVTPTINNDDTVTLLMSFKRVLQLSSETNTEPTDLRDLGGIQSIANVRDGETIMLGGLTSQFFGPLDAEKKTVASDLLALVTARIVRRAGEEVQPVALQR